MRTPKMILFSKYYLIWKVLPVVGVFILAKIAFHLLGWEPFAPNLMELFTTALAGIVFVMGFILAGVFADYKESERMPGDLACSLDAIWQESEILVKREVAVEPAQGLQTKIIDFIDRFRQEFLVKKTDSLIELVESFTNEFASMQSDVPSPIIVRLQNEQISIVRMLSRMQIIRDTAFSESGQMLTRVMVLVFCVSFLLLHLSHFAEGVFETAFFVFVLVSILFLIEDTDDPFEYFDLNDDKKDEINFDILIKFRRRILKSYEHQAEERTAVK